MNTWRGRIAILSLVLLAGCRSHANQELLERDLRLMEDEIYHLEDHLHHLNSKLHAARSENAGLRTDGARDEGRNYDPSFDSSIDPGYEPGLDSAPSFPGGAAEPPGDIQLEVPGRSPLGRSGGGPSLGDTPPLYAPRQDVSYGGEMVHSDPHGGAATITNRSTPLFRQPGDTEQEVVTDYHVSEVTLNRFLTGGFNYDGHQGDEGVAAVVEPRNAEGQIIEVPGELAVVVLDPSLPQRESRVARWDYSPNETADQFHQSLLGRGVHLEMPWPSEAPASRQLHLYVRFKTADGQEFRADQPIDVDVPGQKRSDRWISAPGSSPRPRVPDQGWETSSDGGISTNPDSPIHGSMDNVQSGGEEWDLPESDIPQPEAIEEPPPFVSRRSRTRATRASQGSAEDARSLDRNDVSDEKPEAERRSATQPRSRSGWSPYRR